LKVIVFGWAQLSLKFRSRVLNSSSESYLRPELARPSVPSNGTGSGLSGTPIVRKSFLREFALAGTFWLNVTGFGKDLDVNGETVKIYLFRPTHLARQVTP